MDQFIYEPLLFLGFPNRFDTNRTEQPQKMAHYLRASASGAGGCRFETWPPHMKGDKNGTSGYLVWSSAKSRFSHDMAHMSLIMRKPDFCICINKDADQLRGDRKADQCLCFRYMDSAIPLLSKSKISSL